MTRSRERIIAAGFELFETTPFKEVTVEDILKKSYTSRGTFYRYFRDKYELMNLYYSRFLNEDILSEFNGSNWKELQARCYKFGEENSYFFRNVKVQSDKMDFGIISRTFPVPSSVTSRSITREGIHSLMKKSLLSNVM